MTDKLRSFLEGRFQNSKTKEFVIGVADSKLGASISEGTKFSCRSNEFMLELLRGVRLHFEQFIKNLKVFLDLAEKDLRQIKALFLEMNAHIPCKNSKTTQVLRGFSSQKLFFGQAEEVTFLLGLRNMSPCQRCPAIQGLHLLQ
ncbi:hypothetical protein SOVF_175540 isoform B [Spinacia oleracea]|nr:hypothetical protein SOVF_175540 isoform B [Spinacia oleracea]